MNSTAYATYSLCKNVLVWSTPRKKQAKTKFTLEQATKAQTG